MTDDIPVRLGRRSLPVVALVAVAAAILGALLFSSGGASPTNAIVWSPQAKWGDVDCNGSVGARDAQAVLRSLFVTKPALSQTEPCEDIQSFFDLGSPYGFRRQGDVDCSGSVGARDAQAILRSLFVTKPPLSQTPPCPAIGSAISGPDTDWDDDGISNDSDLCPYDPEDFDGYQDWDGCPDLDNDGDGILDSSDGCPNQAEDFDNYEDWDGCPEEGPVDEVRFRGTVLEETLDCAFDGVCYWLVSVDQVLSGPLLPGGSVDVVFHWGWGGCAGSIDDSVGVGSYVEVFGYNPPPPVWPPPPVSPSYEPALSIWLPIDACAGSQYYVHQIWIF